MIDNLEGSFVANGKQWQYIPNNCKGIALFDGETYPTKGVLELIGREGVKKIDAILKGMKRVKEIIYGPNSADVAFSWHQYFATIPAQQKNRSLPFIFENNPIIVSNACLSFSLSLTPPKDQIRRECFDEEVFSDILTKEISLYRDYVLHLISEVNPVMQKKVSSLQEFEKIKKGDTEIIEKIQGNEFLSDYFDFL